MCCEKLLVVGEGHREVDHNEALAHADTLVAENVRELVALEKQRGEDARQVVGVVKTPRIVILVSTQGLDVCKPERFHRTLLGLGPHGAARLVQAAELGVWSRLDRLGQQLEMGRLAVPAAEPLEQLDD